MKHLGMVHDKVLAHSLLFGFLKYIFSISLSYIFKILRFIVTGGGLLAGGDAGGAEEDQHQHQEEGGGGGGAEICQN